MVCIVALKALLFDWLYLGLHFKAAENVKGTRKM